VILALRQHVTHLWS